MDADVVGILEHAGIDTSLRGVRPRIRVQLAGDGRLDPVESRVTVELGAAFAAVELKTIPQAAPDRYAAQVMRRARRKAERLERGFDVAQLCPRHETTPQQGSLPFRGDQLWFPY